MFLAFPETNRRPRVLLPVGRPDPKKRPDYKEEKPLAQGIGRLVFRLGDEAEALFDLAAGYARQALAGFRITPEVAVVEQRDPARAMDQHRALVVQQSPRGGKFLPAVIDQPLAFIVHDERRIGEPDVDALRAILEEPAAACVGGVIARNELAQRDVADALALDQPVAAAVEIQPAIDGGNVRPLGQAANDHLVHRATIFVGGGYERNRHLPGEALARALPARRAEPGRSAPQVGGAALRRGHRPGAEPRRGGLLRPLHYLPRAARSHRPPGLRASGARREKGRPGRAVPAEQPAIHHRLLRRAQVRRDGHADQPGLYQPRGALPAC